METTTLSTTNNTALDISEKDCYEYAAQTNSTINNTPESNMEKDIKSLTADLFPWVCEFQDKFGIIYRDLSMHKLTELMQYYTRNITASARECYSKPLWAVCLKKLLSDTLIVFLNIYRMVSENNGRCIYLNYMSDLLAIYIDAELEASKRTKEDQGNICARLISCLYIYLEHSTEHLLDTLLKVQFMYQSYHGILNPVITKIIKNIPLHPESNMMYVRYLLVYRLWRNINSNEPMKNEISAIAINSLGPLPPTFPHLLDDVLPKVPKLQPNPAKLLLHDKFDTKRTCEFFVQFSKESNINIFKEYNKDLRDTTSSSSICNIKKDVDLAPKNVENFYNNVNSNLSDNSSSSNLISSHNSCKSVTIADEKCSKSLGKDSDNISTNRNVPKLFTKIKSFSQRNSKKPKKVILIDLTSDVQQEKCLINKRRSKKLAWLEEVKKQLSLKSMKTSVKMKNGIQNMLDNTNSSKCETESDYQLQNTTLKTSKITSKDNAVDTIICDVKNNGSMDSENSNLVVSSLPKLLTSEKLSSSIITSDNNERSLDAPVTTVTTVDSPTNTRKYYYDDVLVSKKDNTINDRLKPAVINRLTEKDISIKNEICEKSDGKKKICDLKPQPSIIESITTNSQCNSKDEIDSLNLSKTVEENSASENEVVYFNINQDEHVDQNTLVNKNIESACVKEKQDLSTNSYFENTSKSQNISAIELDNSNTNKNIESERCTILKPSINNAFDKKDNLINNETLDQQQVFCESLNDSEVSCTGYLNSKVSFSVMTGDDSGVQAEVEIDNSIEVGEDINVVKTFDFENKIYNTEEELINNVKNTRIHDNEIKHTCKEDIVNNQYINQSVEYNKQIYNENHSTQKAVIENLDRSKSPSYPVSPTIFQKNVQLLKNSHNSNIIKSINKNIYETEEINSNSKISGKEYILHNNELNTEENIDGLSLLASVSQHVSHLKAESEMRFDQIKIKDYAVLKNTSLNQVIDDKTNTNDSSNTVSQLCENPTSEVIKRVVGVYPEDGVYPKKLELYVNLISANNENVANAENTSAINVPRIFQGSMNYETSDTLSNIMVPLENNVQSTKENTNVIQNGETVILMQKSPNSNLYIINKAVENARNRNDNDTNKITEKSWVLPLSENGSSYEIANALDHNFIQEKHSIGGKKNIKIEPNEDNIALNLEDKEFYTKKISLRANRLSTFQATLQDIDAANLSTINESNDKHKSSSKSVSACRQNIKQEFTTLPTNYTVQGYAGMHSHSHEAIESQHSLHIPTSHPTALPQSMCNCNNCSAATDLCVPYHKHCKSVSCSLQINTTASLHSHVNSSNPCGRSHGSCLNCTYDIVTHCRQCIHPGTDSHVSCIESNSYFLPMHSSVQTSTVQEHERTKNETVIGKLYEDNIVCKVEKNLLPSNTLETIDMKCDTSKLSNTNYNSKLPLKKRLKAHAMMSIADLEKLDTTQKHQDQIVEPVFPLSPNRKDDIHGNYHFTTNLVRRDYCKDIHDTTAHDPNTTACQESFHQRTFKTPAQRKEIATSEITAIKRFTSETMATDVPYKKGKKMQSPTRRTRSSKRNVPKVNYSYTDNDPEWNLSGVLKRKRRKNSR